MQRAEKAIFNEGVTLTFLFVVEGALTTYGIEGYKCAKLTRQLGEVSG